MISKPTAIFLAGFSISLLCVRGALAETIVSIPEFPNEEIKKHTAAKDEKVVYSSRPSPPLQLRRANNLLAAGHYNEAIQEYEQGADKWLVPMAFRSEIDRNWGVACERAGKTDEAIRHYKEADASELLAKLYFKLRRYSEAKEIADKAIIDARLQEARFHGYTIGYPEWLRLRAAIEVELKAYQDAITDLETAARKYYKADSEKSELCVRETNALLAMNKLGVPFQLELDELPQTGKHNIIQLVSFLVSSPQPFDLSKLSKLIGTEVKVPGPTWPNVCQIEQPPEPFRRIEYQADQEDYHVPRILEITLSTNKCCIPRSDVEQLKPGNAIDVPAISFWNGYDEAPQAEVWKLPTAKIRFYFGLAGARILEKLELEALQPEQPATAQSRLDDARHYSSEQAQKKVELLSESIKLDDRNIDALLTRSRAYLAMGKLNEALADANRAVTIGGRPFLNDRSIVEERMGNNQAAIADLKEFIGGHAPGPETTEYFVRLAELYIKNHQYMQAIEASNNAMKDSHQTAGALFERAKAYAGLDENIAAKKDATEAANQYFEQARIVLRDEVLDWLAHQPNR